MILHRSTEICAAELDGEVCLFNPENAEYLNLNGTGSTIWNLLEMPMDMDALVSALQGRYEVDSLVCHRETEAFVAEALKRGMLVQTQPA
jgi:Coenzyme PQQ synthesis protein D (PqqD)